MTTDETGRRSGRPKTGRGKPFSLVLPEAVLDKLKARATAESNSVAAVMRRILCDAVVTDRSATTP